ncbi:60S acidic ribosomal protein P0 [Lemmus lemmus]
MLHCGSRQCGLQADVTDPHPSGGTWRTTQLWRNCCLISGGMWALYSPRRTSLKIRDVLLANKVPAAARAGAIAPCEVTVPAQNTGLGPEKTSFFQALGITTKISRGTIEILSDVQLIKTGDKVGASEATLLNMLNTSPFSLGLIIQQVFDNGSIYNPEVIDITEQALHSRFLEGVRNVASVCLQIGYPTVASVPHFMGTRGFWLCLWRLNIPSHLLKRSRPSWLIHLHLWLLPP